MARLPMTIRCRLIAAPGGFPGLLDERGCGRVGPYIARAVHNPGQWGSGDQLLGRLPSKRPQQALHNRMLSCPELLGLNLAQPADDGERRQLRLLCQPALDRRNMWVELGGHAYRADEFAGGWHAARRPLPSFRASWRKWLRLLTWCSWRRAAGRPRVRHDDQVDSRIRPGSRESGQQHDRIQRAILIAQPFLQVRGYVGMRQGTLLGARVSRDREHGFHRIVSNDFRRS